MARNYAALPWEYRREMAALNDAEFGRLCKFLLEYSETGTAQAPCGNERFFAERVMMQEDRFKKSYEDQIAKMSNRGRSGAKARWANAKDAKACLSMQKHTQAQQAMQSNACDGKTETETETNVFPHVVREYRACVRVEQPPTPPISGGSDQVASVLADFLDRINPAASSACLDELRTFAEEMGEAVCKRAFDIALDAKKASWPYIRAILRDKHKRGIKCLADWEASEKANEKTEEKPDAKASEIGRAAIRKLMEEANE